MTFYYRKAWAIVAWSYGAALHCSACTIKRFGRVALDNDAARDREGNWVRPVFASDDMEEGSICDTCGEKLSEVSIYDFA